MRTDCSSLTVPRLPSQKRMPWLRPNDGQDSVARPLSAVRDWMDGRDGRAASHAGAYPELPSLGGQAKRARDAAIISLELKDLTCPEKRSIME